MQAVTVEAFAVGKHHRYDVAGAGRRRHGQGAADGRHRGRPHDRRRRSRDRRGRVTTSGSTASAAASCSSTPTQLVALQQQDGSIPDDDARLPVTGGVMHTTYQAMQTWRQAYSRTADDKWLPPIRKAERYLARPVGAVEQQERRLHPEHQLRAARPGRRRRRPLRGELAAAAEAAARAPEPGRRLGAGSRRRATRSPRARRSTRCKLAGHTDGESAIARGARWLAGKQGADGSWRTVRSGQGGAEKAEGDVGGAGPRLHRRHERRGERARRRPARRRDHGDRRRRARQPRQQDGGVRKVEIFVDDLPVEGACAREAGVVLEDRRHSARANTSSTSSPPTPAARTAGAASRCSRATSS